MAKGKEPTIKEMLQSIDSRLHRLEIAMNKIQTNKYSNLTDRRMCDKETLHIFENRNNKLAFKSMFEEYIKEEYPELNKKIINRNKLLDKVFSILDCEKENKDEFRNLANMYTQAMMRHHGPIHHMKIKNIFESESKKIGNESFFSKVINTIAEEYTKNPQLYK